MRAVVSEVPGRRTTMDSSPLTSSCRRGTLRSRLRFTTGLTATGSTRTFTNRAGSASPFGYLVR